MRTVLKHKQKIFGVLLLFILTISSLAQLFPLIWLVDFSFARSTELFGKNFLIWPRPFQFSNYVTAWVDGNIPQYFWNSIIVNVSTVMLTILFALMMSYAFIRMKWKLQKVFHNYVLLGMMIPIHATLLTNYVSFQACGIQDTYLALILPYTAFALPMGVLLMAGFFQTLPLSIEESAAIDGCSIIGIIFRIVLPIMRPCIVTVLIMTFLSSWNEFIMAATYLNSDKFRTLPFAVYNFVGLYSANYSVQFAVMTLTALPSLIIYVIFNKQITSGITAGALKM